MRAAIEAILSAKLLSWKNMPKLIMANNQSGRNIVANETMGNLYRGIWK